ncbi:MAG: hypothetical protein KF847_15840 [Pirellulales bacterium]|nr:hypothetical protein [Pirellulales bacterium]
MTRLSWAGLAAVALVGWATTPASATLWTLLDNFDGYDNSGDSKTTVATGGVWSAEFVGTNNSHVINTDQGKSLATYGGAAWRGAERNLTGSGAAVLVGEIQTLFWQVRATSTGGGYDFMMGLSPSVARIDTADAWRDFNVMPFVNNAASTPFINAQAPTTPWWAPMNTNEWYNVWVVVDNNATAPSYDLYYSSGTNAPSLVATNAIWRNTGEPGMGINQDLNAIGFMSAGGAGSELWIDNIFFASGEVLTNPLVAVPEASAMLFGSVACIAAGAGYVRRRRAGSSPR